MLQTRDDTVEEVVQFIDEVQYQSLVEEIMTTAERLEKRGELRGELKGKRTKLLLWFLPQPSKGQHYRSNDWL